eukprot:CAMPEP_0203752940 /NCGR_PEP_ID=MMETSP0098-20131031/6796_1 /ASSEMBLY_ACC=CAM_ASM_000208 /TAXON_ID=96639 /ORGANISM=" , Strain NY0313808BC1" /LENGTH=214 /DNA_ID=CAMNT_0050643341 /DNA_START=304 /DNA_END=946 /DNA_ORIENTATION=-
MSGIVDDIESLKRKHDGSEGHDIEKKKRGKGSARFEIVLSLLVALVGCVYLMGVASGARIRVAQKVQKLVVGKFFCAKSTVAVVDAMPQGVNLQLGMVSFSVSPMGVESVVTSKIVTRRLLGLQTVALNTEVADVVHGPAAAKNQLKVKQISVRLTVGVIDVLMKIAREALKGYQSSASLMEEARVVISKIVTKKLDVVRSTVWNMVGDSCAVW